MTSTTGIVAAARTVRTQYLVLSTEYKRCRCAQGVSTLAAICALIVPVLACAQDAPLRLMDQPPFDILTLDKTNDSKVYKIYPVRLPGRKIPEKPKPTDKIRVKLLEDEQEYDIAWSHISKLELYEQMIVAEIQKLATEGKLDDAYDELNFLLTYYPNTPGLAAARQHYLFL